MRAASEGQEQRAGREQLAGRDKADWRPGGRASRRRDGAREAEEREQRRPCLRCRLVEEFMLLANMAVAREIHRAFPERALLRRHPPPQTKMLNDLMEFCEQLGLPMDFSSAGALNVSAGSPGAKGKEEEGLEGRVPQPLHPTTSLWPLPSVPSPASGMGAGGGWWGAQPRAKTRPREVPLRAGALWPGMGSGPEAFSRGSGLWGIRECF